MESQNRQQQELTEKARQKKSEYLTIVINFVFLFS
jgi:hypothetical protein